MTEQRTDFLKETENFEAFDLVTEALEQIDSYDGSKKNVEVLREAYDRLRKARDDNNDPKYFKARYFQAMILYLENNPSEAISQFRELGDITSNSALGRELRYNIAAAYNASGNWEEAIKRFDNVIINTLEKNSEADAEVLLLSRAGFALSCADGITEIKARLKEMEPQRREEAPDSSPSSEERIADYSWKIEQQYKLAKEAARNVVDMRVLKKSEQIFKIAYTQIEGQASDTIIELRPAEVQKKKRRVTKRIIIIVGILIFIFLAWAVYVELFKGWDPSA
jgi:tetratricopeptide (TPR) repeat protein